MNSKQPALRPYLEKIKSHCLPLDKESLIQLILSLAKEVKSRKRDDYSKHILSFLPKNQKKSSNGTQTKELLDQISELKQEIEMRIKSINDGTFWDNPDNEEEWDDSYYLDEDPDLLNEFQAEALAEYFDTADRFFLNGQLDSSHKIYDALFALISESEEYGYSLSAFDIDLSEARSRLGRCIYEIMPDEERVEPLLRMMLENHPENIFDVFPSSGATFLVDIINAATGDLDNFDSFLTSWQTALTGYNYKESRVADLLLEATFLQKGIDAVGQLACKWQNKQPRAYLYWLQELANKKSWKKVREISGQACDIFPANHYREQAAYFHTQAGKQLQNDETILTGYREQFRSRPDISRLLNLVAEAHRQHLRDKELHDICTFLSTETDGNNNKNLLTTALLMAGDIDRAFTLSPQAEPVGWSHQNGPGLLYGTTLYLLCGCDSSCTTIANILESYTQSDTVYFDKYESRPLDYDTSDYKEILKGLESSDTTAIDLEKYQEWVMNIGQKRVNHIVSNTHRGAYERAAMTLCSLAELVAVKEGKNKALQLLTDYCKVRYSRHSAFRREMREIVGQSHILCVIVGEL